MVDSGGAKRWQRVSGKVVRCELQMRNTKDIMDSLYHSLSSLRGAICISDDLKSCNRLCVRKLLMFCSA